MIITKKHKHDLITYYILEITRDSPRMFDIEMLVKPIAQTQVKMQTKDTMVPITFFPRHDL